jgi:hypothetical protein
MFKRLFSSTFTLAIFFAGTIGIETAFGATNPDADHINGSTGDSTISIAARNDADDYRNIQWALDNVKAGGTVKLGPGTFNFGDGKNGPRKTAWVRKGCKVIGTKEGAIWRTTIHGGGEVLTPGVGGALEGGTFRIKLENDDHPVILEDIWFRHWSCEVVFILASNGFEFRGCRITDATNAADPSKTRFVHALWTQGPNAKGDFIADNNLVEMGQYDGPLAEDEQFMGIFTSNHDNIHVTNNTIIGTDEAVEILMNRIGPKASKTPSEIVVANNKIDVTGTPGPRWGGSWAILVAGNLHVDKVRIENNDVTKRGEGWGVGLSGDNFNITGNTFRFEEHNGKLTPGAITIGGYPKLAGEEMGASFNNSVIKDNTFEGKVSENGLFFMHGNGEYINESKGNTIDVGDTLVNLGAKTTITLSKDITDNTFRGKIETLATDAPQGKNKLYLKQ